MKKCLHNSDLISNSWSFKLHQSWTKLRLNRKTALLMKNRFTISKTCYKVIELSIAPYERSIPVFYSCVSLNYYFCWESLQSKYWAIKNVKLSSHNSHFLLLNFLYLQTEKTKWSNRFRQTRKRNKFIMK